MTIPPDTQVILLLTARFSNNAVGSVKPLAPKEWERFAAWLEQQSLAPKDLLSGKLADHLGGWQDKSVSVDRVGALLERGAALAFAVDRWLRAGLWIMTSLDSDYPSRLKKHLLDAAPVVLYGCGRQSLLNGGGLAVVGSRHTSQDDLAYSRELGALASASGLSIISGGARGVDEAAMLGSLNAEGTAIGVMADRLLRACSSKQYRQHLRDGNLVLVSPFHPEAGFNVGNAMQRNKYIYCLADAAFVVHSGQKGGTWSGAQENLKNRWVPLWVKPTNDPSAGNADLIRAGAAEASANVNEIDMGQLLSIDSMQAAALSELPSDLTTAVEAEGSSATSATEEPKTILVYCKPKDKEAQATGCLTDNGFIVYSGSTAVKESTGKVVNKNTKVAQVLVKNGCLKEQNGKLYRFMSDHVFGSPTGASDFIYGSGTNGWKAWKTENGDTLKEISKDQPSNNETHNDLQPELPLQS